MLGFQRKNRRILIVIVWKLALVMLLASCGSERNPVSVGESENAESTQTSIPPDPPPSTPTEEPIPSENQNWWTEYFAPALATVGCIADYDLVNFAETEVVNAIPWTVDGKGVPVTGIIPILCGEGHQVVFHEIEDLSPRTLEFYESLETPPVALGPTYLIIEQLGITIPEIYFGGLTSEELAEFRSYDYCVVYGPRAERPETQNNQPFLALIAGKEEVEAIYGGTFGPPIESHEVECEK